MSYNVAVLGASANPERYSNKAVRMLAEHGYTPVPIHPSRKPVESYECYGSLSEVDKPIDTVTVYLSKENSDPLIEELITVKPRRVILNPGAENDNLKRKCEEAGIEVQEACTLVLIRTGQF